MKKIASILLCLIFCEVLITCSSNSSFKEESILTDSIPESTIDFLKNSDNFIIFETNDRRYQGDFGSTRSKTGLMSVREFNSFEAIVQKNSGKANQAYGIIFCAQKLANNNVAANFYAVVIDVEGNYALIKVKNLSETYLGVSKDESTLWKSSIYLNKGYGVENKIRVEKTADDIFNIYFNSNSKKAASFTDSEFQGGSFGFIVAIGGDENFPSIAINCKFKEIEPSDINWIK